MLRPPFLPLALCACPLLCGTAEAATVQHAEPLRAYRVGTGAAEKPAAIEPTVVSFNAFSRDFALELEPNGRLEPLQSRLGTSAAAYRGKVAGRPDSWVRVVLTPAGPSGLVFDGATLYGVEAAADAAGTPTMFRLADVYFAPGELGCASNAVALDGVQAVAAIAQEFPVLAAEGATLNLDLGAVADFEFSQRFGFGAEAAVLTRLNNVDGIFSEQLGVAITVAEVEIFTTADDPFTASAANALLDELAVYRGATPSQDAQGLTHLFTGRNLDDTTAGVAYFGSVCASRTPFDTRSFGAGLSENTRTAVLDSLVAAHEIGHNFGAPHDGDANAACASTPTIFLMAPSINGSNQFSACSIREMQAEISGAACLTPIGPANVAVALPQPPADVFAGTSFTYTATVRNTGADAATQVSFTATADAGLTIVAAETGGAGCTTAASSATCALGTVGGGAARGLTLTLRAESPGTFDLTGAAAADSDADGGDDSETVSFAARPLIDLILSGAPTGVPLDGETTVNVGVENSSDFAATSVVVTGTSSAGLRLDQATLGGAACTVTAASLSCPARTLAARGKLALVVSAAGIAAGSQRLSISAVASEDERTPADNQLALAVNVSAPAAPSGGGGGAVSWWVLVLLLAARGLRSRALAERRRHS